MPLARHFPPPWVIDEHPECFSRTSPPGDSVATNDQPLARLACIRCSGRQLERDLYCPLGLVQVDVSPGLY